MGGFLSLGYSPFGAAPVLAFDQPNYRVIDPDNVGQQGPLIAEITISEDHSSRIIISRHPVEQGAIITDHTIKEPEEVRCRLGWSNAYGGYTGYVKDVFHAIQQLQSSRQPFTLYTGLKVYTNMLVAEIHPHTDAQYEYATLYDIVFQQILTAVIQPVAGGAINSDPAQHGDPTVTQPTTNSGNGALTPNSPTVFGRGTPVYGPVGSPTENTVTGFIVSSDPPLMVSGGTPVYGKVGTPQENTIVGFLK